jgi:hypothetical protein
MCLCPLLTRHIAKADGRPATRRLAGKGAAVAVPRQRQSIPTQVHGSLGYDGSSGHTTPKLPATTAGLARQNAIRAMAQEPGPPSCIGTQNFRSGAARIHRAAGLHRGSGDRRLRVRSVGGPPARWRFEPEVLGWSAWIVMRPDRPEERTDLPLGARLWCC